MCTNQSNFFYVRIILNDYTFMIFMHKQQLIGMLRVKRVTAEYLA